jgi:hypothetical protein
MLGLFSQGTDAWGGRRSAALKGMPVNRHSQAYEYILISANEEKFYVKKVLSFRFYGKIPF